MRRERAHRSTLAPGYLSKLLALAPALSLKPGTVTHVEVRHDDWCPRLRNPPGECACDPDVAPMKGSS